ncbi:spermatogenesis-associated protein 5-like protein 1 [Acanthaster planci]|uniref:Spermatogenesis-associated protein 5-like protein 1 n=1 Tax=Acanthaster planci TaxID=133434 RepID=A0A8B7ZDY9_ACAPL|nr:spermatogenesis-associated protein 5-like protein 1 [Acanthaster planci]XP_022101421.1 spermatogenesis-associated protein 5-like protein 1 [Acanthaster planci]
MSSLDQLTSSLGNSTQRCLVGPGVLEQLSVPIGSWCIVELDGCRSICSLWVRNDLQDGPIEVQDTVTLPCQETKAGKMFQWSDISVESIQPVPTPVPCEEVTVSVLTDFKHLRSLQQVPREAVIRQLRQLLMGCVVMDRCTVSLPSDSDFAGPKISHIVVEKCSRQRKTELDRPKAAEQSTEKEYLSSLLVETPPEEVSVALPPNSQKTNVASVVTEDKHPTMPSIDKTVHEPSIDLSPSVFNATCRISSSEHTGNQAKNNSVISSAAASVSNNSRLNEYSKSSDSVRELTLQLISEQTKIRIKHITSTETLQHVYSQTSVKVGGLDEAASLLRKLIEYPDEYPESLKKLGLLQSHGILLRGPPGCGKTSLMLSVASQSKVCLLQVSGAEIFGASPGESESNLRQIFDRAFAISETHRCVLFIDELDVLCPKRDYTSGSHESRVVAELLMLMDEVRGHSKVLVVGATSRPNVLDPALRRPGRFDQEVLVGMPSTSQRVAILESHCQGMCLAGDVDLRNLAERCSGFSGADLAYLCQQAIFSALERSIGDGSKTVESSRKLECPTVMMGDFTGALSHVTPSLHRAAGSVVKELQPVPWEAIGGLAQVKAQLKQAVEWPMNHWQSFVHLGLAGPSGVLLYGPPGCCKTILARAAATACHASFLALSCAELYSPFVGDSEKIITEVFRKARLTAPSIVFLDELDSLIGGRGTEKGRNLSERLLSCLLVEMDGIGVSIDEEIPSVDGMGNKTTQAEFRRPNVLVVAASNRIDLIDAALLRPGRFDCLIYVPPPDQEARQEILGVHTKNMPLAGDVNLTEVAKATHMYTGADLEGLCREAGLLALQEHGLDQSESCLIHHRHFVSALDWCRPSLTEELVATYQETNSHKTYKFR